MDNPIPTKNRKTNLKVYRIDEVLGRDIGLVKMEEIEKTIPDRV